MPNSAKPRATAGRWFANRWAWAPVLLLGGLLGTQLVVLSQVLDDPSFSVEPGYYQKAVDWDESRRGQAQCQQLGWAVNLQLEPGGARPSERAVAGRSGRGGGPGQLLVRVAALDGAGQALTADSLSVEAFANSQAEVRVTRSLQPVARGHYEAVLPVHRLGLWVFRVQVRQQAHDCQYSFRRDIPRLVSSTPAEVGEGQKGVEPWN